VQVITFGQPRVGTHEFALFSESRIAEQLRFVHNRDLVPHLPPNKMSFYHVGEEIFETEEGYKECGLGENEECCNHFMRYAPSDHLTYMNETMGMNAGICMWPNGTSIDFDPEPFFDWSSEMDDADNLIEHFSHKMEEVDSLVDRKKEEAAVFFEETKGKIAEVETEIQEEIEEKLNFAEDFIKNKLMHRNEL